MKNLVKLLCSTLAIVSSANAQDTLATKTMYVTSPMLAIMVKPGKGTWDDGPNRGYLVAGDSVRVLYNKRLPRLHDPVLDAMLDRYLFVAFLGDLPLRQASEGWVLKSRLTTSYSTALEAKPLQAVNMYVSALTLPVRETPSSTAVIVGSLSARNQVKVLEGRAFPQFNTPAYQKQWAFINYFDSPGQPRLKGWVARQRLVSSADSAKIISDLEYKRTHQPPKPRNSKR